MLQKAKRRPISRRLRGYLNSRYEKIATQSAADCQLYCPAYSLPGSNFRDNTGAAFYFRVSQFPSTKKTDSKYFYTFWFSNFSELYTFIFGSRQPAKTNGLLLVPSWHKGFPGLIPLLLCRLPGPKFSMPTSAVPRKIYYLFSNFDPRAPPRKEI